MKEKEESLYKAENFLTEHDLQIVALDLPERMQLIDSWLYRSIIEYRFPQSRQSGSEAGVQPMDSKRVDKTTCYTSGLSRPETGPRSDQ